MEKTKNKLLQARWLLISSLLLVPVSLTGCSNKNAHDQIYDSLHNEDESTIYGYELGFFKDGDEYKLFFAYNSFTDFGEVYCDCNTGEKLGKYFMNKIHDSESNYINTTDQFIKFKELDKNLDLTYEEAMELTDEELDNMFKFFNENTNLSVQKYDIFKISNYETGEEKIILGIKLDDHKVFNLETYQVEEYQNCIMKELGSISSLNTRNKFLEKFYEEYYPEKLEEQKSEKTR